MKPSVNLPLSEVRLEVHGTTLSSKIPSSLQCQPATHPGTISTPEHYTYATKHVTCSTTLQHLYIVYSWIYFLIIDFSTPVYLPTEYSKDILQFSTHPPVLPHLHTTLSSYLLCHSHHHCHQTYTLLPFPESYSLFRHSPSNTPTPPNYRLLGPVCCSVTLPPTFPPHLHTQIHTYTHTTFILHDTREEAGT